MTNGHFYFVKEQFYIDFDPQKRLMQNKEMVDGKLHNRPCFYAFEDKRNKDIFWCVPISHKVEKYRNIVKDKLNYLQNKGVVNPRCDTILFGEVLGSEKAFLIQNMFPITKKYIDTAYIDRNTQNEVTIRLEDQKKIIHCANKILKLVRVGNSYLVFADILNIYKQLEKQLQQDALTV